MSFVIYLFYFFKRHRNTIYREQIILDILEHLKNKLESNEIDIRPEIIEKIVESNPVPDLKLPSIIDISKVYKK